MRSKDPLTMRPEDQQQQMNCDWNEVEGPLRTWNDDNRNGNKNGLILNHDRHLMKVRGPSVLEGLRSSFRSKFICCCWSESS